MAIIHSLSWSYTASGNVTSASLSTSSESEQNLDLIIPASSTDYAVEYAVDVSQCKAVFLVADADMTLETNSGGSPTQTISLTAGVPVAWITGAGTNPLTSDITSLYVTSTAGGNLKIRTLIDATV